jgi:uncharacterized protein
MTAVFLDANVFLYATGAEHPLREPAQQIVWRVAAGDLVATTSTEVVQEVLHIFQRRGRGEEGIQLGRRAARMFPDMLSVTRADILRACDLLEQYPQIRVRDAIHAATLLNNGLGTILSADAHFDDIAGVHRLPLGSSV